jgi:hypothetical protein
MPKLTKKERGKSLTGYVCPKCSKDLIGYSNGASYGFAPGYPYESGYYCPDRCGSWSNLEISRGALDHQEIPITERKGR